MYVIHADFLRIDLFSNLQQTCTWKPASKMSDNKAVLLSVFLGVVSVVPDEQS